MKIYKNKKLLPVLFFFLVIFVLCAGIFIHVQNIIASPRDPGATEESEFVIESGEGVKQIALNLENKNFINGKDFFEIYVWEKKLSSKLQAGTYEISPAMTIAEIVDAFVKGRAKSNEVWITIPEGFSNKEIDKRLAEKGLIKEGEFLSFGQNPGLDLSKYEFLKNKPENYGLEGFYFPDTYKFYKSSSLEEISKKMLDNFDKKMTAEIRDEVGKSGKSFYEVVILASIIEKEAKYASDMKKIASVFQNRLEVGKALESDATINYITGSGRAQSTYSDLKIDSPFNTYKYAGLPPTPISNPGINAIEAVLYPAETDYFYFLTRKDNGETVFSKNYKEHLENKKNYLDNID